MFALTVAMLGTAIWAEPPATAGEEEATAVEVGVYVNRICDIDLRGSSFTADFWVWFRWEGKAVNPLASFEVVGGDIESKTEPRRDTVKGVQYGACRVVARITKQWDTTLFPLDSHVLEIAIEDTANDETGQEYVADTENSAIDPDLAVPGWVVASHAGEVASHVYATNYGDPYRPRGSESAYSRFTYSLQLEREGHGVFLKTFFGLFISALIALLALLIKPTDLDPRFGLGIGAIFAAVASEYVVVSTLPESTSLTMADQLHMLAFGLIFVTLAESTWALHLANTDREAQSRRIDRISLVVLLVLYLGATAVILLQPWG